ncbi:hypothetical protein MO767_28575 [Pseudomonas sp. UYIF39]|uniref:hypothetical protein n=1 Tax=Pseudomonas sp. UYIF39 TaxID=1630747 RepID=UPI00249E736E|nr:hypothetical protein [Pseudomonas sp. UYIF39]MDI3358266.1 hypothetical protein [Pseudomonas sp. UYIF39]
MAGKNRYRRRHSKQGEHGLSQARNQIRVRPAASCDFFDFQDQKTADAADGPAGRGSAGKPWTTKLKEYLHEICVQKKQRWLFACGAA